MAEFYDEYWSRTGDAGDGPGGFRGRHTVSRFDAAAALLGSGRHLLDAGCGPGVLIDHVRGRFERYTAVDVSEVALELARKRPSARDVEFVRGSLDERLPFADATFDAVCCIAVIEHVVDPYAAVTELGRVLAPNGLLVAEVPNLAYVKRRIALALGRLPETSDDGFTPEFGWDGGHLHAFTVDSFSGLLRWAGFRVERVSGAGIFARARRIRPSLLCGDVMVAARKAGSARG